MTRITQTFRETFREPEDFPGMVTRISGSVDALLKSGINKKAVIILLCHETKLPQRDVKRLLDELSQLAKNFCEKKEAKP